MSPLLVIITSFISTFVKDNLFLHISAVAYQPTSLSMNSGKSLSKASSTVLECMVQEMLCRKSYTLAFAEFTFLILKKQDTHFMIFN